jgi:hypothetical protein
MAGVHVEHATGFKVDNSIQAVEGGDMSAGDEHPGLKIARKMAEEADQLRPKLKRSAEERTVRWEWADFPRYSVEPCYFELNKFRPGEPLELLGFSLSLCVEPILSVSMVALKTRERFSKSTVQFGSPRAHCFRGEFLACRRQQGKFALPVHCRLSPCD